MKRILFLLFILIGSQLYGQTINNNVKFTKRVILAGYNNVPDTSLYFSEGGDTLQVSVHDGYADFTCLTCDSIHFFPPITSATVDSAIIPLFPITQTIAGTVKYLAVDTNATDSSLITYSQLIQAIGSIPTTGQHIYYGQGDPNLSDPPGSIYGDYYFQMDITGIYIENLFQREPIAIWDPIFINGSGGVIANAPWLNSVTATPPIYSSGGVAPDISILQSAIDTVGIIVSGTWNGSSIDTNYTDAVSRIAVGQNLSKTHIGKGDSLYLSGKIPVENGGTNADTNAFVPYSVVFTGVSNTGAWTSTNGSGTAGKVLVAGGANTYAQWTFLDSNYVSDFITHLIAGTGITLTADGRGYVIEASGTGSDSAVVAIAPITKTITSGVIKIGADTSGGIGSLVTDYKLDSAIAAIPADQDTMIGYVGTGNNTHVIVDDPNKTIEIESGSGVTTIGDANSTFNGTYFRVDDTQNGFVFNGDVYDAGFTEKSINTNQRTLTDTAGNFLLNWYDNSINFPYLTGSGTGVGTINNLGDLGRTSSLDTANTNAVSTVTVTAPITVSTEGKKKLIAITQSTTSTNGYLSSTDWNTFNGKGNGTVTSIATGYGLSGGTISTSGTLIADSSTLATKTSTQVLQNKVISTGSSYIGTSIDTAYTNAVSAVVGGLNISVTASGKRDSVYLSGTVDTTHTAAVSDVAVGLGLSHSDVGKRDSVYLTSNTISINGTSTALGGSYTALPDTQVFTSAGDFTWTKPTGCKGVIVVCYGAGGGGASGGAIASGTAKSGGTGGGGGSRTYAVYMSNQLPATVSVTCGAGGTHGTGVAASNPGQNGTVGDTTEFGTYLLAFGGGPGLAGLNAAGIRGGGTGAGTAAAGVVGQAATATAGGAPSIVATQLGISGQGGGSSASNFYGGATEWGGAAGGNCSGATGVGCAGGSSLQGGTGGGSGGGNASNTRTIGGDGGARGTYISPQGISSASSNAVSSGATGGTIGNNDAQAGTDGNMNMGGGGGGGGSSGTSLAGQPGKVGGKCGGGGGGGGASNVTSGDGGDGGCGCVYVISW